MRKLNVFCLGCKNTAVQGGGKHFEIANVLAVVGTKAALFRP